MKKSTQAYILAISLFCIALPQSFAEARTLTINSINPNSTVSVGTAISFTVTSDDSVKLSYTVSDTLPGSTISNANFNSVGAFSWTPQNSDVGNHTLTITSTDSSGNRNTVSQNLTITDPSYVRVVSLTPSSSIWPNTGVSFGVATPGFINPVFTVTDSFSGSTIFNNIDSFGNFNWTPKTTDVGTHNLTIRIRGDNGRNDVVYQTLTVNGVAVDGVSRVLAQQAKVGQSFVFKMNAYGMNQVNYRIGDSKAGNSTDLININGNTFTWIPQKRDVGLHTLTITGDDGSKVSTAQLLVEVSEDGASVVTTPVTPVQVTPVVVKPTSQVTPITVTPATTTSTKKYVFVVGLAVGSKGTAVIELQKRLKAEGVYTGPTNGVFGPQTKAAVMKYQAKKGLNKVGVVGPATTALLNK